MKCFILFYNFFSFDNIILAVQMLHVQKNIIYGYSCALNPMKSYTKGLLKKNMSFSKFQIFEIISKL